MSDGIGAVDADALKAALQKCTVATQKQMRLSFRDKRFPDITAWFQCVMPGDTEFKVIYDKHGRKESEFKFSDVEEFEEVSESVEQQEGDIFASIEKGSFAKVMDLYERYHYVFKVGKMPEAGEGQPKRKGLSCAEISAMTGRGSGKIYNYFKKPETIYDLNKARLDLEEYDEHADMFAEGCIVYLRKEPEFISQVLSDSIPQDAGMKDVYGIMMSTKGSYKVCNTHCNAASVIA